MLIRRLDLLLISVLSAVLLVATIYAYYAAITYFLPPGKLTFFLLNVTLILYLLLEILLLAGKERWSVLIQPVVLASIVHFILAYFLPNLRYFSLENPLQIGSDGYEYYNLAMLGVLLAAFSMWRGYKAPFSRELGQSIGNWLLAKNILKESFQIRMVPLVCLLVISGFAIVLKIRLGLFGISSSLDSILKHAEITAWLKLAEDAGMFAFLLLSLAFFSPVYQRALSIKILFGFSLLWYVSFGFLSGFKSAVVLPFIIVGVSYYIIQGRFPAKWAMCSLVFVVLAYQVIEPFRQLRFSSANFENTSLVSIAETLGKAASSSVSKEVETRVDTVSVLDKFLARQDLTKFTALSFKYLEHNPLPKNSPNFLGDILMAPINAYVPRFIWSTKSYHRLGYWYNVNVLGANQRTFTAVAMGPISYARFAGGFIGIFVIFLYIGILQRLIYEAFAKKGLGGVLVFLALLSPLVMLTSSLGGMFAGLYRMIPFVLLAQYLVMSRKRILGMQPPPNSR